MTKYLFFILLFFSPLALAADVPNIDMTLKKVSEHVYYVQGKAGAATEHDGFISNAAVIVTDTEAVIFDTLGTPALAKLFIQEIKEITDKPIKKVILSHYHADHIYGLNAFQKLGVHVFAPEGVHEYLNSDYAHILLQDRRKTLSPWVNKNTSLVEPNITIADKTEMEIGGVKLTLLPQGGIHSVADMTLLVQPDNVLLTGDIAFAGRIPWVADADTKVWLERLEALKTMGADILVPGHGQASDNAEKLLQLTIDYITFLREKMSVAVDELQSFDEAYAEIDWTDYKDLPAFKEANRRNAYQVYLAMEHESL